MKLYVDVKFQSNNYCKQIYSKMGKKIIETQVKLFQMIIQCDCMEFKVETIVKLS
jgi:hypothetical protein